MLRGMSMIGDQGDDQSLSINKGIELMLPKAARREKTSQIDLDLSLPIFWKRIRLRIKLDITRKGE